MKKTILALMLFTSFVTTSQTKVYKTSNTANVHQGKWTHIAKASLTHQYQNQSSTILISGGYSGIAETTSSKLFFRTKQQAPFPGEPHVQLELIQTNNSRITKNDIIAIITTASNSSIIDLYLRVTNTWEILAFTPVLENNTSASSHMFLSNQGYVSILPTGIKVACKFIGNGSSTIDWTHNSVPIENIDWGNGSIGIGTTTSTADTKLYVKKDDAEQNVGIVSEVKHTEDWKFGILSAVSREKTKAFSVYRKVSENNYSNTFAVMGNGSVYATELTLSVPLFADYVFEEEYDLMTLSKLDTYIKKYKHLPNMPSEKEVLEKGLSIGELQIIQTEKIEELTLYAIEQNKKIKELEKLFNRKLDRVIQKKLNKIIDKKIEKYK
jgi:hypothetical protein